MLTILIFAILATISPGPDFIIVTKNAMLRSRKAGVICTLGICAAILVHTLYCVLGLGLVISNSILLFNIIKYCGAAYLVYLGIKSLCTKHEAVVESPTLQSSHSLSKSFYEGFLTNMLNPKCTLFILSVFTVVINPETGRLMQFAYGVEIAMVALVWFSFLSFSINLNRVKSKVAAIQSKLTKVTGGILIVLGVKIAVDA